MKRIVSFVLIIASLFTTLAFASNSAKAANCAAYLYEQREQYNAQHELDSGFYGNVMYHIDRKTNGIYVRTALNGKAIKIAPLPTAYIKKGGSNTTIYKNYIYYITKNGFLCKCAVNGKYHKAIKIPFLFDEEDQITLIATNNRLIINLNRSEEYPIGLGLYVCDLNGKNFSQITSDLVLECYSWGTNLYFINYSIQKLMHYSFKTNKLYSDLSSSLFVFGKGDWLNCETIGMDGKYFYFYKFTAVGIHGALVNIYMVNTATKKAQKLAKNAYYDYHWFPFAVGGGDLYYINYNNEKKDYYYFKYNYRTGQFQPFKALKESPNLFTFYKNKLLVEKLGIQFAPTYRFYIVDTI